MIEVVVIFSSEPFSVASPGCVESLTWFIPHRSPCAYFLLSSLLLSDPKCTVCLLLTRCWTLPTHISFLGVHACVYLCAYESLSSHILLSWGWPFSKPHVTIPEFTLGREGGVFRSTHYNIHRLKHRYINVFMYSISTYRHTKDTSSLCTIISFSSHLDLLIT